MSIPELLRWQWQGYPRYHRSRANLVLHIVVVPIFLLGNVVLVAAAWRGAWLLALLGLVAAVTSIGLQGAGHRQEPVPPEPFRGPVDAVLRIVLEQWLTFPRFVVTGGWARAWVEAGRRA